MSASSFGQRFVVTSFGESHGTALGVVIDGCPAGVRFREDLLLRELQRRRPGAFSPSQQGTVSNRKEEDRPEILSGVFEGLTLGTPLAMLVRNQDQRSHDYDEVKNKPRAGHADDMWLMKFGHRDHRGGGRSSGRETVSRVMAGAVAQMFCAQAVPALQVRGFALKVGPFELSNEERSRVWQKDIDSFAARFPSSQHEQVRSLLQKAQADGESYGGVAEIRVKGVPAGLGQPVFHKLKADLGQAFLSIGATSGVEIGEEAEGPGTAFHSDTNSPRYGGIRGGITTGEELIARVIFKPTSSILDVAKKGRHDPCIVTRAIPVLESMMWLVLADHLLWQRGDRV